MLKMTFNDWQAWTDLDVLDNIHYNTFHIKKWSNARFNEYADQMYHRDIYHKFRIEIIERNV